MVRSGYKPMYGPYMIGRYETLANCSAKLQRSFVSQDAPMKFFPKKSYAKICLGFCPGNTSKITPSPFIQQPTVFF